MINRTPSSILAIDKYTNQIQTPTLLLETRSGSVIGKLKYTNWNISLVGNGIDEITFDVHRPDDITDDMDDETKEILTKEHEIWDKLIDLKLVEIKDYGRFEISVSYTDNSETIKSVHGQSLEIELSQIYLHEFHVNDEDAMSADDYSPTVFYNSDDKAHSLLHRVLANKAPHWTVDGWDNISAYITPFIAMSEDDEPEAREIFQRTYTANGESIYDFLTGTVAEESNVIFVFDTLNRVINCYSLCDCIKDGVVVSSAIGEDTNVFVSKDKLANEIVIESDKDSVKNCFRIEGGDDYISDMIRVANATGSNYIYNFAEFQYDDMSTELKDKIQSYLAEVEKVKPEYEELFLELCKAYNFKYYYESGMMPGVTISKETGEIEDPSFQIDNSSAEEQYNNLITELSSSFVAVKDLSIYTSEAFVGITNNVEALAQIYVDSRYEVEIIDGSTSYDADKNIWSGKFRIVRASDETETYEKDETISITINDDEIGFAEQKLEKALKKSDMLNIKFDLEGSDYVNSDGTVNTDAVKSYFMETETDTEIKDGYSLARLESFYDGYETCVSILMEMGKEEDDSEEKMFYDDYVSIRNVIGEVRKIRQAQVDSVDTEITDLKAQQKVIHDGLDFETWLGEYYLEFCAYRREDTYTNSNYISDGLTDAECIEKAKELLNVAQTEIKKSCVLQRTVSTSLSNLFALPEFETLYDSFALFNYIRVKTEDEVLKLRLIGIDYNGESTADINVTFSEQIESVDGTINDLQSIIDQASSMATTFSTTALQAKQGSEANGIFIELYNSGLNAANILLKNSDSNEVTFGSFGLLCKAMGDEGNYGQKQLRIIGNGIYLTDNDWQSVRMALGQVTINGKEEYGIIADCIVGKLIIGDVVQVSGYIKSENYNGNNGDLSNTAGSIIDLGDGTFNFGGGALTFENNTLVVKGKIQTEDGTIGCWNINSTSLSYGDTSSNNYMKLDAVNKCIISKSGTNKATFAAGALKFYKDETQYMTLHTTRWINTDPLVYGVGINSEYESKFISFGNRKTSDTSQAYETNFLLNYGLNPDDITQGIICYSDIMMKNGSIYFDNNCYLTDIYYTDDATYQGIKCNGYFSTTNGLLVGGSYYGDPGTYALNVKGASYLNGNLTVNGYIYPNRIYFGDYYLGKLTDGGVYCYGILSTTNKLLVGNTDYGSSYMLHVKGASYLNGNLTVNGVVNATTGEITTVNSGLIKTASIEVNDKTKILQLDSCNELSVTESVLLFTNASGISVRVGTRGFTPETSGDIPLGHSNYLWEQVYAASTSISKSDRNEKKDFRTFDSNENYEKFFMALKPIIYKFINGKSGRDHFGFISQDVEESLFANGFDDTSFGGFCKDIKVKNIASDNGEELVPDLDENGNEQYLYSLRYEEFIALNTYMIQKHQQEVSEIKSENQNLKSELDNLKQIIQKAGLA